MFQIITNEANSAPELPTWRDLRGLLRSPYTLLLLIFVVSRIVYYLLGVRFDARGLAGYLQFIDLDLLQHHLLQSLFYLHMQPPGYNLFLGVVLKLFPHHYVAAFHAIHLAFGAVITCLLFYLMRCLRVVPKLALITTMLFVVSPGVVLFENFILYEYQMMFFLTVSAVLLFHSFAHRSAVSALGFLVCQFWLVMVRNQYHLVYFAVIYVLLLYFTKHNRRLIAGAGSILLAVVLSLYLKNLLLFGQFVSSTWMEMNLAILTSRQLTPEERQLFVSEGKLSRLTGEMEYDSLSPIIGVTVSSFRPYITMPPPTSIPVLDREIKFSGATANYNHRGYLEAQKVYRKDVNFLLLHYPMAYIRLVTIAWFAYFLPNGDFLFFDSNLPHVHGIERFFDNVFFGQFKHASGAALRQLHAQGAGLSLVLYTGVFLLIGLPVLFIFGVWFLYRGIRMCTLDVPQALLLSFLLFNILYCTMTANFLSSYENNRYRFPVDGFFVVLLTLALDQLMRKLIRMRRQGNEHL